MAEKFDILIQAGQSNAEGCGHGPVRQVCVPSPDLVHLEVLKKVEYSNPEIGPVITYENKPFSERPASVRYENENAAGEFSLTFANRYIESGLLEAGRKLLVIRAAIGATSFKLGFWGIDKPLHEKMLAMTDYALSQNPESRLVAFLWHQGESDVSRGILPEDYRNHIYETVSDVRSRYGVPTLPFVAGDFVHHWKATMNEACHAINQATISAGNALGHFAFVETDGLESNDQVLHNGDTIHFSRQAQYELGERYFAAFMKARN